MNLNGAYPYRVHYQYSEGDSYWKVWAYCLARGEAVSIARALNKEASWPGQFYVYDVKEGKRI